MNASVANHHPTSCSAAASVVVLPTCSCRRRRAAALLRPQPSFTNSRLFSAASAGYGFVDFDSPAAAQKAVSSLKATGVQAQMAKVRGGAPPALPRTS